MTMLIQLASSFLLFPANLLLLAAAGLWLRRRWRYAHWLSWGALALLWLFSTRVGALLLVTPLEIQTPALQAIP